MGAADVTANGAPAATGLNRNVAIGASQREDLDGPERSEGRPGTGTPRAIICRCTDVSHLPALVTGLAFLLATVFGAVATRVNFCTMGAISDVVNFGDTRRLRMWLLAIAVAIAGAAALQDRRSRRPVEDALHRQSGRLAVARRRRIPVRLRDDVGLGLRQQVADPRRRRQPEIADRPRVLRHFRVHDAEGSVRALAHDGARSAALRRRGDRGQDLRPALDPRGARRRRRDQAVVSVRVRGGDRGLGAGRRRIPRDAAR